MTQRYKLIIEYDGTEFVGMQRQDNGVSIQAAIEEAIKRFSGEVVTLYAAGRTDSGVHAIRQTVHFDLEKVHSSQSVSSAINHFVNPHKISVILCEIVKQDFHARFSAKSRSYIYKIANRQAPLALLQNKAWHVAHKLDVDKMHEAAQVLIGKHDLSSFRSSHCQAQSAEKTISEIQVSKVEDELIQIFIKAPSFLHNQVRIIVGCLKKIGEGKWNKQDLKKLLEVKDRTKAAATAPACGLYFCEVEY